MAAPEVGPVVAQGRTASIHAWRDGQILKLFQPEFDRAAVEQEARIARAVRAAGAPAPEVGEVVAIAGRYGLVYEQIDGAPMSEALARQPWRVASLGRRLARLHAHVHALRLPATLPAQHVKLASQIQSASGLSSAVRQAALDMLAKIPPGDRLCHGDFHPANVLMGATGDTVIDWADASRGHPLADVARTVTILMGEAQPASGRPASARRVLRQFCSAYLAEYKRLAGAIGSDLKLWRPVIAAARFAEGLDKLGPWLAAQASRNRPLPATRGTDAG